MGGNEGAVAVTAFGIEEAGDDFNAGVAELADPFAGYGGVGVEAADYDAGYLFADDEVAAWWRFAVVDAWFKGDVEGGAGEERGVGDGGYGVDFGVGAAELLVVSFADDAAVGGEEGADHGVWTDIPLPFPGKVKGALHQLAVGVGVVVVVVLVHQQQVRVVRGSSVSSSSSGLTCMRGMPESWRRWSIRSIL